jgi:hypothetical protein
MLVQINGCIAGRTTDFEDRAGKTASLCQRTTSKASRLGLNM